MSIVERISRGMGVGTGREVTVGTLGTIGLNAGTLGLNFVITVVLSRLLGASGYGAYAFALAWALVLSSVAGLGLSPLVVRETAAALAERRWGALRGVLLWSNRAVLLASVLTVVVAAGIGGAFLRDDRELLVPYLVGLTLVVPLALTMIRQSAMQGLGRVLLGRTPEALLAPGLFLVVAGVAGLVADDAFTASWALSAQLLASTVAFAVGVWLLVRSLPREVRTAAQVVEGRAWRRSGMIFLLLGLLLAAQAQIGTIVLGVVGSSADAGVFAIAVRISTLVGFVLLAATYPLMPVVARLHATGDDKRLRATVTRTARLIFVVSLPLAALLFLLASPVLDVFGDGFVAGETALRILVLGEVAKAFLGLAGLVLVMTGNEDGLARGLALGVVAYALLAVGLGAWVGVTGVAVAATASVVAANVYFTASAWRRLGVYTPVIRPPRILGRG